MRALSVCFVIASLAHISLGAKNKLYVTFSSRSSDPNHSEGFYELPRRLDQEASRDGWTIVEELHKKSGVAVACRDYDYRVCLLVDKKNSVAGLQFSVAIEDLEQTNAPIKRQLERKVVLGTEVYSATAFFVDSAVLKAGGRLMSQQTETAPNGIFVKTENGLRHIPKRESDLAGSKFVRQRCFPGMGLHYFYDLSKKSDCKTLDTYEALYDEQTHELVGAVYIAYGNVTVQKNGRQWFENINLREYKYVAHDGPKCTSNFFTKYGAHSLHFYITDKPWNLKCKDNSIRGDEH